MSFQRIVYLYCDGNFRGCECEYYEDDIDTYSYAEASGGDSQHETITSYRKEAKKRGWIFRGMKTYCPVCVKKLNGEPK